MPRPADQPVTTSPPADGDALIRFRGVCKRFGERTVLDMCNLHVGAGEKVSIIGPSGSGKTTILRMLMTLEQPDEGVIELDGESLWGDGSEKHLRRMRRKVGMVFQQFNLFPHMTVLQNVTTAPVKVLGLSQEEADARARELLQMVGLDTHLQHKPAQLSGGQQQRVAIARAMAMQPQVMLFDEVTSALDPELVGEVLRVIRELAAHTDMTMLIVTHEMHFADDISDCVLMFDAGAVIERGPPQQVLHEPRHERTQRFLKAILDRG